MQQESCHAGERSGLLLVSVSSSSSWGVIPGCRTSCKGCELLLMHEAAATTRSPRLHCARQQLQGPGAAAGVPSPPAGHARPPLARHHASSLNVTALERDTHHQKSSTVSKE